MLQLLHLCSLLLPILCSPHPQVLFRDTPLVHQLAHSHGSQLSSVSHLHDSTPGVLRHLTQARRLPTLLSSPLSQPPALVQHSDGRFFAVNANIQPGQFFQTADGQILSLAPALGQASPSAPVLPPSSSTPPVSQPSEGSEEVIIAARDSSEDMDATEAHAMETTSPEPVAESPEPTVSRMIGQQQPIATAPFTPSTARFVSAVPALSPAPSPVSHISHSTPFLTRLPSSPTPIQDLRAVQAIPAGRAHSLADSKTSVFTGYFSFPSAGLDFDF